MTWATALWVVFTNLRGMFCLYFVGLSLSFISTHVICCVIKNSIGLILVLPLDAPFRSELLVVDAFVQ